MKKPLIVIGGPTASGKTSISIELAKKVNGEIISADSMQVYKYMDIGTAKITKDEMSGVTHHMIDILEPDEEFSVAIFKKIAKQHIDDIHSRGKIPILVGGTGFYINAIVYNNEFLEKEVDYKNRERLMKMLELNGAKYMHELLKSIDEESYLNIHENNTKRVIRAIEYFEQNGEPISVHNLREKNREQFYDTKFIILNMDRSILYERINYRVDKMINDGLIDEVKMLINKGYSENLVSMQGIGYKEIVEYIKGITTLEESIEAIKKGTRNFAKRQLTWFKHQSNGQWVDVMDNSIDEIVSEIRK